MPRAGGGTSLALGSGRVATATTIPAQGPCPCGATPAWSPDSSSLVYRRRMDVGRHLALRRERSRRGAAQAHDAQQRGQRSSRTGRRTAPASSSPASLCRKRSPAAARWASPRSTSSRPRADSRSDLRSVGIQPGRPTAHASPSFAAGACTRWTRQAGHKDRRRGGRHVVADVVAGRKASGGRDLQERLPGGHDRGGRLRRRDRPSAGRRTRRRSRPSAGRTTASSSWRGRWAPSRSRRRRSSRTTSRRTPSSRSPTATTSAWPATGSSSTRIRSSACST